jgi:hypothetical protein
VIEKAIEIKRMAHLLTSRLFSVKGIVAVITGGGSGTYSTLHLHGEMISQTKRKKTDWEMK